MKVCDGKSAPAGSDPPPSQTTILWQAGLLALAALAVYFPALNGSFVWDDDAWTTGIAGLFQGISGLLFLWLQPAALQQYYPLTGTSFWLDYQIWNFWTLPYHVENVLLHVASACLLWRLLRLFKVPGAWLAAFVFALHPVMVESVAWITERKNVLSLVFYLGALLAFGRFAGWGNNSLNPEKPDGQKLQRHPAFYYNVAFFLFICALLAKTTSFSLPAAILLITWWQRGKIRWREDALPTMRFFALALAMCAVTFWLEKYRLGASGAEFELSLAQRCLVAGKAFWFYLAKLLWPANLCFVYPRWQPNPSSLSEWLYPAAALALIIALWLARCRIGRAPLAALLFYAGTLFPVLGFMNAYGMRYSFVWDHWVYLPSLGVIVLATALMAHAAARFRKQAIIVGFAAVALPSLGLLTWRQAGMFTDVETLWRTTLQRNPACPLAHNNLGTLLYLRGETEAGVNHYRQAIAVSPDYYEALYNLGLTCANAGQTDEAISLFRKAISLYPTFPDALNSLGFALCSQGQPDEAGKHLRDAIRLKPDFAAAHYNLGMALLQKGDLAEASRECQTAIQLAGNSRAYVSVEELIESNNEAWKLATSPAASERNGPQAVALASLVCERSHYQQTVFIGTLAAAYVEADRFDEAVATAQKACALAARLGQTNLFSLNQKLLERYQQGKPWHEPAAAR